MDWSRALRKVCRIVPGVDPPCEAKKPSLTNQRLLDQLAIDCWERPYSRVGAYGAFEQHRLHTGTDDVSQQVCLGGVRVTPAVWPVSVDYRHQDIALLKANRLSACWI